MSRWIILAVLAAVMAALLTAGVVRSDGHSTTIEYAEGGTDPVATLSAMDPEGATSITWGLLESTASPDPEGVDADVDSADDTHFDISEDGVLTFDIGGDTDDPDNSVSPDFEAPRALAASGTNTNTYKVVVTAADAGGQIGYHKITVMVTNVDEPGKVTWAVDANGDTTADAVMVRQFQVGAILTASATDGDIAGTDKAVTSPIWRWYRGETLISGEDTNAYTVAAPDVGSNIRVVATYVVSGNVDQETASLASDYPVMAARSVSNQLKFDPAAVSREIPEGDKGMNVGAPVMATGNHGAVNYTLGNATNGVDNGKFMVDPKTGQITTNVDLNYDSAAGEADNCTALNSCVVTVRATDATGDATAQDAATNVFVDATVTIKITNVDEKPAFTSGYEVASIEEGGTVVDTDADTDSDANTGESVYTATDPESRGVTYHLMGPDGAKFQLSASRVLSFRTMPDYENPTDADSNNKYQVTVRASDGMMYADRMVTVSVTDMNEAPAIMGRDSVSYAENGENMVATFTATDPEGATSITWSIPGAGDPDGAGSLTSDDNADEGHFDISEGGVLTFDIGGDTDDPDNSVSPDFEAPRAQAASGTNTNTYMVVVAASDGATPTPMIGYHKVTIMVTDVAEPGKVTWTVDPDGTGPLTVAGVNDGDPILQFQVGATLTASATDGDIAGTDKAVTSPIWRWYRGGSVISGEDTNEYTVADADVGSRIRVVVTYRVGDSTAQQNASLTSDYPVRATRVGDNQLKFDPAAVSREIPEGDEGSNVGAPVTATGNHGAVNYTLGNATNGVDNGKFMVDPKTGQITTNVDLNYDSAAGADDNCTALNSCVVTIRATDATGTATVQTAVADPPAFVDATVTIKITNVDEKPTFTERAAGVTTGIASPTAITRDEGMAALADTGNEADVTYAATDPEGLNVNLMLMGPDAAKFGLNSTGVLSFEQAPDYENPTDANGDNVYEVTVRASDGTMNEDRMVRVTVTDVDEAPEISAGLSVSGPESPSVDENTTAVGTYMAAGPGADMATWDVMGDDGSHFSISADGMLMFASAPNYEMPRGMAMSDTNTNTYMVTVKATAGEAMDSMDVEVMVTNADDDGTVSVMPESPMAGADLTAMLTDEDGGTANQMWTWETSSDGMAWNAATGTATGEGTDSSTYTSVTDDGGMYVRAMVSYDDALGMGRTAMDSVMVRPDTAVGRYDTNGTPGIQLDEVLQAIDDLFNGGTLDDVLAVIDALFG